MKFTLFYVVAALAAFAAASPVPVADAEARAARVVDADLVAREPIPVAEPVEVKPRVCRRYESCI